MIAATFPPLLSCLPGQLAGFLASGQGDFLGPGKPRAQVGKGHPSTWARNWARAQRHRRCMGKPSSVAVAASDRLSGPVDPNGEFGSLRTAAAVVKRTQLVVPTTPSSDSTCSSTLSPTAGNRTPPTSAPVEPLDSTKPQLEVVSSPGFLPLELQSSPPCAADKGQLRHRGWSGVAPDARPPSGVIDRVRSSRAAQGLSLGVTDPVLLAALRRTLIPARCARDKDRWNSQP